MTDTAIFEDMPLDFTSPFDELTELRSILTTQEIAELTGLRRETISRARPDSHFHRRTEQALRDLYVVVTRMRAVAGADPKQLGAVLRRPQGVLGDRSVAELLRQGEVDLVLEHLAVPEPTESVAPSKEDAVQAFLDADPEMAALLPEIEAKLRDYFAPVKRIERNLIVEREGEAEDMLALRVYNDLSFDENSRRFISFLEQERDLRRPVRSRLNIGFI